MKKTQMTSEGAKDDFDSYIPQQLPYTNLVSREQYIQNYYTNYLPYTTQGNISDPTASWSSNGNDSIAYISSYDINPYDQFSFGFQPAYNFGYTGTGDYTTWTGIAAPQLNSIGRKTVYEEYYRDNRYSSNNMYSIGNNRLHDGTIPNETLKNTENGINNLKIGSHNKNENLTSKENDKERVILSTSNKNTLNSSNCDSGLCDYNTKKNNDNNSDNNNNNNSCNNNNNNNNDNNDNNEQNNSISATQNKSWASVVSAPLSSSSSTTSSSSVIVTSMNSNFKKPYTKQNLSFSNQSQVFADATKLNLPNSSSIITHASNSRQRTADFQNSNITNHTQSQNNTFNNSNLMNAYFYRHYNNNHSHVQNGITYNHSNFISNRIATTNQTGRGKSTNMCNNNSNNNNNNSTTSITSITTSTTNNNNINDNGSDPTIIINNETNNNNKNEEIKNSYLNELKLKNQYNPKEFDLVPKGARFFVIKSYSEDDVHRSIKYNIWCSTEHGNRRLDQAFREREGKGPVYLFFSVNGSGHFCGMAEMMSCVDYDSKSDVWSQDKWKGKFEVKWIYVKDVPNSQLRNIRLENNENKPVTNSRDTQEIPFEKGKQVLKVFHQFHNSTSIFDDFEHYERRQDENFKKYDTDTVDNLNFQS